VVRKPSGSNLPLSLSDLLSNVILLRVASSLQSDSEILLKDEQHQRLVNELAVPHIGGTADSPWDSANASSRLTQAYVPVM
jgi:hypothetical protein